MTPYGISIVEFYCNEVALLPYGSKAVDNASWNAHMLPYRSKRLPNRIDTSDGGLRRSVFKTRSTSSRGDIARGDGPFRTSPRQRINSLLAPRQLENFARNNRVADTSDEQARDQHEHRSTLQGSIVGRPASEEISITAVADLGPRIRKQRKALGFSQQQLADLSGVGRRFVSELEAGKSTLEFDRVLLCCRALGLDVLIKARD